MSKKIYKIKNTCRLCKSSNILKVVEIGETPVSEKYSDKKNQKPEDTLVPLDLYFCLDCSHVQLIHVVDPDFLWDNFTFKTSRNPKLSSHYTNYVKDLLSYSKKFMSKGFVVDIGSNDGTLLKIFKENGFKKILGIDPAKEIAKEASDNGIETIPKYFNYELSDKIKSRHGKANVVTANNVYAHIDDMDEITNSIKNILNKDGIFSFEVSYLQDVIEKKLLGTIFHEHLSYHSLSAFQKYFKEKDLEIINVIRNPLQGGSIVCYVQHKGGKYPISKSVKQILDNEEKLKINKKESLEKFNIELQNVKEKLNKTLDTLRQQNKKIAGFGSARSATTLINYFNINSKFLYIVDDNKDKHFKFTPGNRIEVFPTTKIYEDEIDFLIIFAWEHSKKIMDSHKKFSEKGGKFINIFPEIQIV